QEQHIQTAQLIHRLRWDVAVIREISRAAETESVNWRAPVQQPDGHELQSEKFERLTIQRVRLQLGDRGFPLLIGENVLKAALDCAHGVGGCKDGDLSALPEIERPHIIESHNVV